MTIKDLYRKLFLYILGHAHPASPPYDMRTIVTFTELSAACFGEPCSAEARVFLKRELRRLCRRRFLEEGFLDGTSRLEVYGLSFLGKQHARGLQP